jgi:hypothetical protein
LQLGETIMSAKQSSPDRREVLAASAAVVAATLIPTQTHAATTSDTIRQFNIDVPEAELTELRQRLNATRWPERETVTNDSQGVPLAMIQELARYWATDYDWRKCEARLLSSGDPINPWLRIFRFISTTQARAMWAGFQPVVVGLPGNAFSCFERT